MGFGCCFAAISPQTLIMLEYCLSVMAKILIIPLLGASDLTRLMCAFMLSYEPQ